jgi:DMSO/TMAO reductase YedYZ molybdopterin-dependent catalytic subunit
MPKTRLDDPIDAQRLDDRRRFLRLAGIGSAVAALGAWWLFADDDRTAAARNEALPDGRPRLPPGQRVLERLKPMGGAPGSPSKSDFRLQIHGEVEQPFTLDFAELLALPQQELELDVHCVTGWSVLGAAFTGVRIADLAARAKPHASVRHVILEGAHGYTANVRLDEALAETSLVCHRHLGEALAERNGAPVRALIPQLYFWKSTKWLTGIRFVSRDEPGYWEVRGYHNHADPWLEERYG